MKFHPGPSNVAAAAAAADTDAASSILPSHPETIINNVLEKEEHLPGGVLACDEVTRDECFGV